MPSTTTPEPTQPFLFGYAKRRARSRFWLGVLLWSLLLLVILGIIR